jgi:hypothetical protein
MSKITFEIEDKEYELPEIITIENYAKVYKIKDLFIDEYFTAKLLSILTGAPVEKLMEVNYVIIEKLGNYAMSKFPTEKTKFIQKFEFNGVKYGFIPNWKELSFGEFIDLDTLMSKKGDDLLDHIHIITAILYRPIISEDKKGNYKIEKYDSDKMLERAEEFKKLDSKYFFGGQFFFQMFATKYFERTQQSLIPKMSMWMQIKILWKARKIIYQIIFKKDLDGSASSIDLQTMILQNIIMSSKPNWWKRLTNSFFLLLKVMRKKDNMKPQ